MERKIVKTSLLSICTLLSTFFIAGCRHEKNKVDIANISVNLAAERLESDLLSHGNDIQWLKNKYGSFFRLYTTQIVHLAVSDTTDTVLLKKQLNEFVNDADIKNVYADTKAIYNRFDDVNMQLTDAFKHYKYYFPNKLVPRIVTFISGFNYAIVSSDSALGLGLDMYLGSDSRFYPALQLPQYKIRKMSKSYLVADAVKGWAQTEWEEPAGTPDLLSNIIYQGKMLYFLDMMMPDTPDSIKTGYTEKQLEWCKNNEKNIWSFFIDHKLLFVSDVSQTAKYTSEGPNTGGFPNESPGNVGQWIGYSIVQSYMKQYPNLSLEKLMLEQDYKKIFRDSKYKPKK